MAYGGLLDDLGLWTRRRLVGAMVSACAVNATSTHLRCLLYTTQSHSRLHKHVSPRSHIHTLSIILPHSQTCNCSPSTNLTTCQTCLNVIMVLWALVAVVSPMPERRLDTFPSDCFEGRGFCVRLTDDASSTLPRKDVPVFKRVRSCVEVRGR